MTAGNYRSYTAVAKTRVERLFQAARHCASNTVDGLSEPDDIAELFARSYEDLIAVSVFLRPK
jgi:hypothetical protein